MLFASLHLPHRVCAGEVRPALRRSVCFLVFRWTLAGRPFLLLDLLPLRGAACSGCVQRYLSKGVAELASRKVSRPY